MRIVYPGSLIAGQKIEHNGVVRRIKSVRQLDGPPNEYEIVLDENLYVRMFDFETVRVVE
jgi:hypothetical protein